ncbi:hypothetical protein WJX81_007779 [Elliptochloris bilobata]|uniref:Uncharacterized protein n=1 Tax=Elliptochloris bilobata TaxID=381761 RepID=A0AAW1RIA4_9CHLO
MGLQAVLECFKRCFGFNSRPMLQPHREDLLVDSHQGLGRVSYHNPLGRVSITRQSPEQLERGSIVHFKPPKN